jgi:hypothetical protein
MSNIKRAIADIQDKGWPVNNDSLKRLVKEREEVKSNKKSSTETKSK